MEGVEVKRKIIMAIPVYMVLALVSFNVVLVFVIPFTPSDAMENVPQGHTDPIRWMCPDAEEMHYRMVYLDLAVTEEDFKESMSRDLLRSASVFVPSYAPLVDPNDKYVRQAAEHIQSVTEGYPDSAIVGAALCFVQCAIDYVPDDELYGYRDFPATPTETLYLRAGDCEDSSILLASILLAMDYDTVLLDYPHHYAVGVRWEGQDDYLACQTTSVRCPTSELAYEGDMPKIIDLKGKYLGHMVNGAIAYMRYGVERLTGV